MPQKRPFHAYLLSRMDAGAHVQFPKTPHHEASDKGGARTPSPLATKNTGSKFVFWLRSRTQPFHRTDAPRQAGSRSSCQTLSDCFLTSKFPASKSDQGRVSESAPQSGRSMSK
jgi:hypothetical protein